LTSLGSENSHDFVRGTISEGKKRKYDVEEEASEWETDHDGAADSGRMGKRRKNNTIAPKRKAGPGTRGHDDEDYENVLGGRREVNAQSFLQQVNIPPSSRHGS
jgi:hypothetical protein